MTLSEYITREFGIVPDEVQLQKIRLISFMELNKEFDLNNINTETLNKIVEDNKEAIDKNWTDLQHMGFSLVKI